MPTLLSEPLTPDELLMRIVRLEARVADLESQLNARSDDEIDVRNRSHADV